MIYITNKEGNQKPLKNRMPIQPTRQLSYLFHMDISVRQYEYIIHKDEIIQLLKWYNIMYQHVYSLTISCKECASFSLKHKSHANRFLTYLTNNYRWYGCDRGAILCSGVNVISPNRQRTTIHTTW